MNDNTASVDADVDRNKLLDLARAIEAIRRPQQVDSNYGGMVIANAMERLEDVADYIRQNLSAERHTSTVIDPETGLEWQAGTPDRTMTWKQASRYAARLDLCGKTDWRLPTQEELVVLYTHGLFPHSYRTYWSSSAYVGDNGKAWFVIYGVARGERVRAHHDVRCVRSIDGQ